MTAQTMYIGEIASDDCRGALGSFMQVGIVIGILYVYCIGPYVSFIAFQYICLIIPIVFLASFSFMPDSPHFYISKGRKADAIKSLQYLRGKTSEGVQEEFDTISASVEESMKNKGNVGDIFNNKGNLKGETFSMHSLWTNFFAIGSFNHLGWSRRIPTTFGCQRCAVLQSIDLWKGRKLNRARNSNDLCW